MTLLRAGWLERLLARPRAMTGIALLALFFTLPALRAGFYSDDHAQVAFVEHRVPELHGSAFDVYRLVADPAERAAFMARGPLPWWTAPDFRLRFFRPLTSLLFALDHVVYGRNPVGYHLTAILLYTALLFATGRLYRRVLGPVEATSTTAALALLLFAIDASHGQALAWVACRHLIVTALPAVLGLLALLRYREERWRPGLGLAALGLAVALFCGESAVGAAAYFISYALLGPTSPDRPETSSRRTRMLATLPFVLLLGAYAVMYKALGFGVKGSDAYIDPASSPLDFLRTLAFRVPALLGDLLAGFSSDLAIMVPHAVLVIVGLVATVLVALLTRSIWASVTPGERAALRWLIPGAVVALALSTGGFLGSRLLFFPSIGGALFVAVLLRASARQMTDGISRGRRIGLRFARGALLFIHLFLGPLSIQNQIFFVRQLSHKGLEVAYSPALAEAVKDHVVMVWASDPLVFLYPTTVLVADLPPGSDNTWHPLSASKGSHRVTRTGPSSLRIESLDGPMLQGSFEKVFYASSRRFQVSDRVALQGTTVTVVAEKDGAPTAIEATFDRALDDPKLHLLAWVNGRLERLSLPAGAEPIKIDWSPGPFGFF
ncbi:MAG: hypothetical protein U0359_23125 [Byssovorax sp.]